MSTSKGASKQIALRFTNVTKTFAHQTGQKLLRQRLTEMVAPSGGARFTALDSVSFELAQGESLGLIGPNGAGKSTLLNLATGLALVDSGTIDVRGRVASMLELGAGFHPDLTGAENLSINAAMLGLSRKETAQRFDAIVDFAGIGEFIQDPLRTYSSGMVMRLAFSVLVHTDPDLVLMDEVIGMGDQEFYAKCLSKLREFQRQGKTIMLASHSIELITMLCQKALWLDHGRVVQMGPAELIASAYQARQSTSSSSRNTAP